MRGLKHYIGSLVLSASFLLASGAEAMPIPQFDKLTKSQQADFQVFLIASAHDTLVAQGKTADAEKVMALFELKDGKPRPAGIDQFVETINGIRKLNQEKASDPNFKPFEVEHALSLTLRNNGVFVPVSKLIEVAQTYQAPASGNLSAQKRAVPAPPAPGKN